MTVPEKRKTSRTIVAAGILLLWMAGLGVLARRELFRPRLDQLTEAGLRINQYTSFFALRDKGTLVGYASSLVDTTSTDITITDYMVRETSSSSRPRATKRAKIHLSRTFKLKDFESSIITTAVNIKTTGKVEGDSLVFTLSSNDKPPTTSTIKLDGPLLLPNLVQFAIVLMEDPKVGRKYTFPVFDPARQGVVQVQSRIQKETTFVLADTAGIDTVTKTWKGLRDVPVKAWLVSSSPGGFNGWVDETGHIVRTTELEADVLRSTYEESFENWMLLVNDKRRRDSGLNPDPLAGRKRPPTDP